MGLCIVRLQRCVALMLALAMPLPRGIGAALLRTSPALAVQPAESLLAKDADDGGAPTGKPSRNTDSAAKVERLLVDIDETVKKSGSDAEFVFATLYSYDHQLEVSLTDEAEKVGKDLVKLKGLQRDCQKTLTKAAERTSTSSTTNSSQNGDAAAPCELPGGIASDPDELAFSITFVEAVLRIDRDFTSKVRESMKRKAELVVVIRSARQAQHKTLTALLDLLRGRYKVDVDGAKDQEVDGGVSFLQARASQSPRQPRVSNLQFQIEAALKKKEDTHEILMRIKDLLGKTAPTNADSVQGLVGELAVVLKAVDTEHSKAEEAKQRCESQQMHAGLEKQGLRANMALMNSVHRHTQAAIQAAKSNLQHIVAKMKDLQLSTREFSKVVRKTTATLEDQSKDRQTIMVAVEKAHEIVALTDAGGRASGALLEQMLRELQAQEAGEHAYRAAEVTFRGTFLAYAQSYLQLLRESRGHYESSLSALELYAEEVESDVASQEDSLSMGAQLQKESTELCQGILRFYGLHKRRYEGLSRTLHEVLPSIPAAFGDSPQRQVPESPEEE